MPDFSDFFFFIFPSEGGILDIVWILWHDKRFFNFGQKKREKRERVEQVAHSMKSSGKSNGAALRVQRRVGSVGATVVIFMVMATIPAVGAGKRCRRK